MRTPHLNQRRGRKKLSGQAALVATTRDGWSDARLRRWDQGPFDQGLLAQHAWPERVAQFVVERTLRRAP